MAECAAGCGGARGTAKGFLGWRWGRMLIVLLLLLVLAGWPARAVLAWGRMGHRASAIYTDQLLTPAARAVIRELLEPGESLADAATWADENSREIPGSASWHYVNVPVNAPRYERGDCRSSGCVISKIHEFRAVLADREAPRARRRQALRFYVHLVQDLHQPLHVADRNDRGGNAVQLDHRLRSGRVDRTNLHQLWDSGLFREHYRSEKVLADELRLLGEKPDAQDWLRGTAEDWANESLALGKRAYGIPKMANAIRNGATLGQDYDLVFTPLATERLAQAGKRLASDLNALLR